MKFHAKAELRALIDAARALVHEEEFDFRPEFHAMALVKLAGAARAFVHREDFLIQEALDNDRE